MLKIEQQPVGILDVNCYTVYDNSTRQALIIDPGADAEDVDDFVIRHGLSPQAILLTHAHVDHIGSVPTLASRWRVPVWLHRDDLELYESPQNELLPWLPHVLELPEPLKELPDFPGFDLQCIHTPGHTQGGCSFYFPTLQTVITGDTLFAGTIGRTDLPGGHYQQLLDSIRNRLFTLPGETIVRPGHGRSSTIATEKMDPFFS